VRYIDMLEKTWYDKTRILSPDGYYTTHVLIPGANPGIDAGICFLPLDYMGFLIGYNSSLNTIVLGMHTGIYF
ncbi:MAG: hypothetical protein K0B52_05635, partial [FCB group bacterium]|nr:hypothetical protein [FCB group bacterium]